MVHPDFTMSMFGTKEALYQAKSEYFEALAVDLLDQAEMMKGLLLEVKNWDVAQATYRTSGTMSMKLTLPLDLRKKLETAIGSS